MFLSKNDIIKYECYKYDHQSVDYSLNEKVKAEGDWFGVAVDIYAGSTLVFVREVLDAQTLREVYEKIKYCRQALSGCFRYEIVGCTPEDSKNASDMAEYLFKLESKAGILWRLSIKFLTDDEVKEFKDFVQGKSFRSSAKPRELSGSSQNQRIDSNLIKGLVGLSLVVFGYTWMLVASNVQHKTDNHSKVEHSNQ